jgi:H+-transporting ATPase
VFHVLLHLSSGALSNLRIGFKEDLMRSTESFRNQDINTTISELQSDLQDGLTAPKIKQRLIEFGYNEIITPKRSIWLSFFKRFWGLSAWMLELTMLISGILHRYSDVIIILSLLIINAFLGFFQDQKVSKAVDQLKQKLNITNRVLRTTVWLQLPARELVPGDIIRLRVGDLISADAQIIEGDLSVDQSSITGESDLISVASGGLLYAGSIIKRGEAIAIVINTGKNTFYGKTTELISFTHSKLHMEALISKTVKWLFGFVLILAIITIIVSMYRSFDLLELLPLILVLLLSAIPVALPVMFTVTMALGSMELLKNGVLITRLSAQKM